MKLQESSLHPAELRAVLDLQIKLKEEGKTSALEETINIFLNNYEKDWEREKLRRDNLAQKKEIEKHKWLESEKAGRDLGDAPIYEWKEEHAPFWREWRESLEANGFLSKKMTVNNKSGLHMRPSSTLIEIAKRNDTNIYVHKKGMEHYNFKLMDKGEEKPYVNIESILAFADLFSDIAGLEAVQGTELEFIVGLDSQKEKIVKLAQSFAAAYDENKQVLDSYHDFKLAYKKAEEIAGIEADIILTYEKAKETADVMRKFVEAHNGAKEILSNVSPAVYENAGKVLNAALGISAAYEKARRILDEIEGVLNKD